jgi:arginine/lysine/ornithine decarboxylase
MPEITKDSMNSNLIIKGYIIPYPPGVPLAVPGDVFTRTIQEQIARLKRAGVEIFFITH